MKYKSIYKSKIGNIILTSDGKHLTGLWFDTIRFEQLRKVRKCEIKDDIKVFKLTKCWLEKYFDGKNPNPNDIDIDIDIKLTGSEFSMKVLNELKNISYGTTTIYGDIAFKLAKKTKSTVSAKAVGHAIGLNPISIIIPCHRVIGKNGNLTGYASGLDKKLALLKIENVK